MIAPVGKSGPLMNFRRSLRDASGWSTRWLIASTASARLCGGMLVAIPTAMPDVPFTIRLGSRAGSTVGSCSRSSKLGTKSTVFLSMSSSIVIAVRVILAEHVADDCGALLVGAPGHEPQLVHGVQDAAVHGLEPIAHVGERALHDHAHRVVEERLAHLVFDEAREDAFAGRCGHETKCQVLNVGCQQGSARLPKLLKNNHLGLERQRETGR